MHKGILWSVDSLLPKGGCSFASFAVMSSIVFCLFSFVPLSRHKTCLNCSSCYMIFFLLVVFTATLHQACCYALHLKSCVVDKSVVLFVILSIIVLYEFLCKHCFISSDCCIARCICLFHTKIFAKGALLFDFPLTPPSFFFFRWFRHAWPWLCCPWCSFLSFRKLTVEDDPPRCFMWAVGSFVSATEQPGCLYPFSPTLFCILALRKHLCHTMVKSVFVQVIVLMFFF